MEEFLNELRRVSHTVEDQCFQDDPEYTEDEIIQRRLEPKSKRLEILDWCTCTKCSFMPTLEESTCCKELSATNVELSENLQCITDSNFMLEICLDPRHLEIIVLANKSISRSFFCENYNRLLRKAAYKSFTLWAHGHLGYQNRVPIPSCVVNLIRNTFPDPHNIYQGFHWCEDYSAIDMAFDD